MSPFCLCVILSEAAGFHSEELQSRQGMLLSFQLLLDILKFSTLYCIFIEQ